MWVQAGTNFSRTLLVAEAVYTSSVECSLAASLIHPGRDLLDLHTLQITRLDLGYCRGIKSRDAAASVSEAASEPEVAQHGGMLGASSPSCRRHQRSASQRSASEAASPTATEQHTVIVPSEVRPSGKMLPCG